MLELALWYVFFIYVSFFLLVPFIALLLFSAVTTVIVVLTHLLRLHQLRLCLIQLRLLLPRDAPAAAALPEVYAAERLSVTF